MPYTIFTIEQVTPQFTIVHGAYGEEQALNHGTPPMYPAGSTVVYNPASIDIWSADPARRRQLLADPAGTATGPEVLAAFPTLKSDSINQIKVIRQEALNVITKSAGVLAVYSENYSAAVALLDGRGSTTTMKDGQSALVYCDGFASRLGMSAIQFANYIVAENRRVGPTAYQVEDEYLRLAYGVIPASYDIDMILAAPGHYEEFCEL